ncbi:hypothetical protein EON77_15765 [bacterium]|nr:MAG: hypothetical protein EON77_15765 [bacterium]
MSGSFEVYAEARDGSGWRLLGGFDPSSSTGWPMPLDLPSDRIKLISNAFGAGYEDWPAAHRIPVVLRGLPPDLSPPLHDCVAGVPAYGDLDRPGWLHLDEVTRFDWRGRLGRLYDVEIAAPTAAGRHDPATERIDALFTRVLARPEAEGVASTSVRLVFFWVYS